MWLDHAVQGMEADCERNFKSEIQGPEGTDGRGVIRGERQEKTGREKAELQRGDGSRKG
jgi:hypothetical protein